jgi:DNA-binding ferritin-like protein
MRNRFILEGSLYENKKLTANVRKFLDKNIALYKQTNKIYKSLAVLIGFLRALKIIHTAHHWQSTGETFYGDHLLFARLAEPIEDEVDVIAEKIVGANEKVLTNYFIQLEHTKNFLNFVSKGKSLEEESLRAEQVFVIAVELVMDELEENNSLTRGIEQALGNILDKHEEHLYLLNSRISRTLLKDEDQVLVKSPII